jgi:DNA-binding XRE family transcriptional regulator
MTDFGIWLKENRDKSNMTQLTLSRLAGISVTTLSSLENGRKNPSLSLIRIFCDIFNTHFKIAKDTVFR